MRLFEVAQHRRSFAATDRFKKEFQAEVAANSAFSDLLEDFLRFKQVCPPDAQFNRKDAPFRFGDRKGYWHCHLVYGKRIVTYQIDPNTVYLSRLTDHAAYEGKKEAGFSNYLKGLDRNSYSRFEQPAEPSTEKDQNLIKEVNALAWDLTEGDDRAVLETMSRGDGRQFFAYTRELGVTDRYVVEHAFDNNREQMIAFAKKILSQSSSR